MSLNVNINSPVQFAGVARWAHFEGTIPTENDEGFPVDSVTGVQLSFNGGAFSSNGVTVNGKTSWSFDGLIPAVVATNAFFQVSVRVAVKVAEWEQELRRFLFLADSGTATVTYFLVYVAPSLTIDPFQSPVGVKSTDLPYVASLGGTASESGDPRAYWVQSVQYRVGNGAFVAAALGSGRWSANIPLQPGDNLVTIQAMDPWGVASALQRTITVYQYQMPAAPDPDVPTTKDLGIPTTSSITSWTRMEPQVTGADMAVSSNARLFDPLWMMTRQWQMGEFQAEDTGSPVQVRVRATTALLTRSRYGEPNAPHATPAPYNPATAPLETLVERRPMRATSYDDLRMLPTRVEAGLHFQRMLEQQQLSKYRNAFIFEYQLVPLSHNGGKTYAAADEETRRFVGTMGGRAVDGQRLAAVIRPNPDATLLSILTVLGVATADQAKVLGTMRAWLAWYDGLFAEPASAAQDAWTAPRLEYAVSVAARLSTTSGDSVTLSASEFDGGRLDWSSFDVETSTNAIDTSADAAFTPLNERVVPVPVTFPGAPAARFWEMEDARLAYGLVPVGPTDLAHLMMIEYASAYGNDWYVVPLEVRVGTVTRVDSLVVTDTFGVRTLARPIGHPALPPAHFSMWQQSGIRRAGDPVDGTVGAPVRNLFFLPPTISQSIDGPVLEDVLFARDEMANMAWGIERNVEGGLEGTVSLTTSAAPPAEPPPAGALSRYLLSSTVPPNWVPLLPVQITDGGATLTRLQRAAVLQPDGSDIVHAARSEVLKTLGSERLFDEEVPREGARLTRRRRMVRWTDGSSWVWTAYRNDVGTGEGSAGLQFDQLQPDLGTAAADAAAPTMIAELSVPDVVIEGEGTPYSLLLDNPGPRLGNVSVQACLRQGTARRAAGGMLVDAGSGAAVLPDGRCTVAGTFVATNSGSGAGTLVLGDATLELELRIGTTVLATTSVAVAVVHEPAIVAVHASDDSAYIDGMATPYTATIENLGPNLSNASLAGFVTQGAARRSAGVLAIDAGSGPGVLPNGTSTVSGAIRATNGGAGAGTLGPGPATFELQLLDDDGSVLSTATAPLTLAPNTPKIDDITLASDALVVGGTFTGFTTTLTNPGPSLASVVIQGWVNQGTARRAAGGTSVVVGSGTGVLPTGTFTVPSSIVVSNSGGGTGTLVPGAATFELQLLVNFVAVETRFVPVTLEPNAPTIRSLSPSASVLDIGGASVAYTVTLRNPLASISNLALRALLTQGSARHAAGQLPVDCGAGSGVLPTGTFTLADSVIASNATSGNGTLVGGAATLELQLVDGAETVLAAITAAVTLQGTPAAVTALTVSSSLIINGPFVSYSATLENPRETLSNLSLQGYVSQGAVRHAGSVAPVSCGAGSGILPTGTFTCSGSIAASNGANGSGTLVPGAATFELQLADGSGTVLSARTLDVTLVPKPTIAAVNLSSATLGIGGASVPFTATLQNTGPNLGHVTFSIWIDQGGGNAGTSSPTIANFGSGTQVLPSGTVTVSGGAKAPSAGISGTLVPGAATIYFRLYYNTAYQLDVKPMPVTLVAVPLAITALDPGSGSLMIDGLASQYTATLQNPGPSLLDMSLQGWIIEGSAKRDAGRTTVNAGSTLGVLPNGTFNVTGTFAASNESGGVGTLVEGNGTFLLELIDGSGRVLATATATVSLEVGIVISPPAS